MKIHIQGKEIEYEPFKDELYIANIKEMLEQNHSFRKVLKIDYTDRFLSMLKGITSVATKGFNINTVLSISGGTGQGKSSLVFSLGLMYFPNFTHENVFFFDQQIIQSAHKFKEHDLIIRDENPDKATFGQGSTRTSGQLTLLVETCRKASLNLALIEPSFQANDITKWYLHTVDQDLNKRITRCGLIHPETQRYIGCVCIPIMAEDHPEWVKYQARKDAFVKAMKSGDFTGSKLDYNSVAKDCIDDEDFYKYRNVKEKKAYLITKYPNYTSGEIDTILSLINVIQREGITTHEAIKD